MTNIFKGLEKFTLRYLTNGLLGATIRPINQIKKLTKVESLGSTPLGGHQSLLYKIDKTIKK